MAERAKIKKKTDSSFNNNYFDSFLYPEAFSEKNIFFGMENLAHILKIEHHFTYRS